MWLKNSNPSPDVRANELQELKPHVSAEQAMEAVKVVDELIDEAARVRNRKLH